MILTLVLLEKLKNNYFAPTFAKILHPWIAKILQQKCSKKIIFLDFFGNKCAHETPALMQTAELLTIACFPNPVLPWSKIRSCGNFHRHGYGYANSSRSRGPRPDLLLQEGSQRPDFLLGRRPNTDFSGREPKTRCPLGKGGPRLLLGGEGSLRPDFHFGENPKPNLFFTKKPQNKISCY